MKVLLLEAHTDDEMGCCATLARLLEEGSEVHVAVFSFCEESVPPEFPPDILKSEFINAMKLLGIKDTNIWRYYYPVRHFPRDRQLILENIMYLKKLITPDLVFIPAMSDIHQDHHTIAEEGLRAFKQSTILGYELIQNSIVSNNATFVEINKAHLDKKLAVANCYKSQAHKTYSFGDFLESLAKIRGVQAGVNLAESFETIRVVMKL